MLSHFPRLRLSAGEIRDGVLLRTGDLQDRQGGLPIMPEINQEVALEPRMMQFSIAPAAETLRGKRNVLTNEGHTPDGLP